MIIIAKIVVFIWLLTLAAYLGFAWGYNCGRYDKEENEK